MMDTLKTIAIITGIVFIIIILIIAVFIPKPTKFQYNIFKTVISVAVAGFATTIPGLLEVEIGNFIKAGSAIAVFVLVYFYNPADLVVEKSADDNQESGKVELVDTGVVPDEKYQSKVNVKNKSIEIKPKK